MAVFYREDLTQLIISYEPLAMITSVRLCLSYDILNAILLPSKFVNVNENLHCCNGHHHDITCSRQKCYIMCGHNIIYAMTLSTE